MFRRQLMQLCNRSPSNFPSHRQLHPSSLLDTTIFHSHNSQLHQARSRTTIRVQSQPTPSDIFLHRRQWQQHLSYQLHRAVGVSFEDRQSHIPNLQHDQSLAFIKELNNPYDPNAVAIQSLDGTNLGYISKDANSAFIHPVVFGFVHTVGKSSIHEDAKWGFRVAVQPALPGLTVLAPPDSVAIQIAQLTDHLNDDASPPAQPAWLQLKQSILLLVDTKDKEESRCYISHASNPTKITPVIYFNDQSKTAVLTGFKPVCQAVYDAERLLLFSSSGGNTLSSSSVKRDTLTRLNFWNETETGTYIGYMKKLQKKRNASRWKVDFSLLEQHGITVPSI